jgi:hypothetical protein
VSDEGSSHLGPDEAAKREQAERLQADIYDVVVLLVAAYAAKALLKALNPYSPYPLPPDVLEHHLTELGTVHDSTRAWAAEVLKYGGLPQPQRPAGQAVPVFDFQRLAELSRTDSRARDAVADAEVSVDEAVRQLDSIDPADPDAQALVRQVLHQMIRGLIAASARLMRFDADIRAARITAARQEPARQSSTNVVIQRPGHVSAGPSVTSHPKVTGGHPAAGRRLQDLIDRMEREKATRPAPAPPQRPTQGGIAPTSGF